MLMTEMIYEHPYLYCKCSLLLKFDVVLAVLTVASLPAEFTISKAIAITIVLNFTKQPHLTTPYSFRHCEFLQLQGLRGLLAPIPALVAMALL